uniref:Serine peptidase inhibitor, Kazal type 2, tandem duplicate 1 n=1 Tax=Oncorhynchus kisutch TaxID=8019 RepID=A0A8C7MAR6_ONCKI
TINENFYWTNVDCSQYTILPTPHLLHNLVFVQQADCSQYNLPMCPRNFEPVCGSDGTNYSNECMLCFQNMERKSNILIRSKGEC